MTDIDFIKKAVPFAEDAGYEVVEGVLFFEDAKKDIVVLENNQRGIVNIPCYRDFLQQVIEGINNFYHHDKILFAIHQEEWGIVVIDEREKPYESGFGNSREFPFISGREIDDAKRDAIEYVLERM